MSADTRGQIVTPSMPQRTFAWRSYARITFPTRVGSSAFADFGNCLSSTAYARLRSCSDWPLSSRIFTSRLYARRCSAIAAFGMSFSAGHRVRRSSG